MWSSVIALVNTMHIIQFTLSYTNAVKVLQKSVMINQIEGFSEVEKCDSNNFFSIASFQLYVIEGLMQGQQIFQQDLQIHG